MLERIQTKFTRSVSAFFIFTLTYFQFIDIYYLRNYLPGSMAIALICLVALLFRHRMLRYLGYLMSLFVGITIFYPRGDHLPLEWIELLFVRIGRVFSGTPGVIPTEVATFFLLLFVIILVELWVEYRQIWWGLSVPVGYLLILSIFNTSKTFHTQILVLICIGFWQYFQLQRPQRPEERQKEDNTSKKIYRQRVMTILTLALLAIYVPQEHVAQFVLARTGNLRNTLNDNGFYHSLREAGMPIAGHTGFSFEDNRLGGPLIDDNKVLFTATQQNGHYWRVLSKNYYSGLGWEDSYTNNLTFDFTDGNELQTQAVGYQGAVAPPEEIQVTFANFVRYTPLPYGNNHITINTGAEGFTYHAATDSVFFQEVDAAPTYHINWQNLVYTPADLSDVELTLPDTKIDYLQLPHTLPQRVHTLAKELVAGKPTLIQQVLAIEDYLKNSGNFRYSKMDAAMPGRNDDYVDQFLFETQVGYCDNFSTSMVVLLRSAGIPARWVKGFASGLIIDRDENGYVYAVRNNDAHSWVEVYFEGYGWLPFEPTTSFTGATTSVDNTGNTDVDSDIDTGISGSNGTNTDGQTTNPTNPQGNQNPTTNNQGFWAGFDFTLGGYLPFVISLLLVAGAFFLYLWYPYLCIKLLLLVYQTNALKHGVPLLLFLLQRNLPRAVDKPLINYAFEVEESIRDLNGDFITLIKHYEHYLYGGQSEVASNDNDKGLLEPVVIKINHWRIKNIKTFFKRKQK